MAHLSLNLDLCSQTYSLAFPITRCSRDSPDQQMSSRGTISQWILASPSHNLWLLLLGWEFRHRTFFRRLEFGSKPLLKLIRDIHGCCLFTPRVQMHPARFTKCISKDVN